MSRAPLDAEEMRTLARKMSRQGQPYERLLRGLVEGRVAASSALSVFRRCVRDTLFPPSGEQSKISQQLRAELNAWAAAHGLGRPSGDDDLFDAKVFFRLPSATLDDIDRAAKLAGVERSVYLRSVVTEKVERDLARAGVKSEAA